MNHLIEELLLFLTLNPNLGQVMSALLTSSAVVCVAWALALQLRNRSARARTCVWRITLVMLLAVGAWRFLDFSPPVAVVEWQVPMPVAMETVPVLSQEVTMIVLPKRPWSKRLLEWAEVHGVKVWLSVASAWMLWRVFGAMTGLFWLRKRSVEAPARICQLGDAIGAPKTMRYRLVEHLHSPMLTGWRRATIWLPQEASSWDDVRLRAVLRHELAHFERADVLWHWLGLLTTSLWWWQPLAWLAVRRLRSETEQAADDVAVLAGANTHDYARTLVEIAAGIPTRLRHVAGVTMFGGEPIQQRVRELMKANRWRGRIGMGALSLIAAAAVILTVLAATKVEFKQRAPVYQSTAKLVAGGLVMGGAAMEWQERMQDFYGTIVETIESAEMKRRAQERVRALTPDLKEHEVAIHVLQNKGSAIFNVQAQSEDGKYAKAFLDALLDEFIAFRQSIHEQVIGRKGSSYQQEALRRRKPMEESIAKLDEFRRSNNVITLTNANNAAAAFLSKLQVQLEENRSKLAELELCLADIPAAVTNKQIQVSGQQPLTQTEKDYIQTQSELRRFDNELKYLLQTHKPDHPLVIEAGEKIAKVRFVLDALVEPLREEMKQRAEHARRTITVLQKQIALHQAEALEIGAKIAEHHKLDSAVELSKAAFEEVAVKLRDLQEQAHQPLPDYVAIQERATPATVLVQNGLIPIWRLWSSGETKPPDKEAKPQPASKKKEPVKAAS